MERNEHIHAEIKFVRNFEKSNIQKEQTVGQTFRKINVCVLQLSPDSAE